MLNIFQDPLLNKKIKQTQIDSLVKYWRTHRGTHTTYALKFFICEFLNFANVIAQVRPFKPAVSNINFKNYNFLTAIIKILPFYSKRGRVVAFKPPGFFLMCVFL